MNKVTSAQDVRLPVEVVELLHLKTKDGEPVRVICEQIDELVVTGILKALPGERVKPLREAVAEPPTSDPSVLHERAQVFAQYGPPLIEAGTALLDGDGHEVRPAFWFDHEKPHHPLSIPGRLLRLEDKVLLVGAVMRQSGYAGGAAAAGATFHAGVGGGGPGGVGAVAPGEGGGADPAGGAA